MSLSWTHLLSARFFLGLNSYPNALPVDTTALSVSLLSAPPQRVDEIRAPLHTQTAWPATDKQASGALIQNGMRQPLNVLPPLRFYPLYLNIHKVGEYVFKKDKSLSCSLRLYWVSIMILKEQNVLTAKGTLRISQEPFSSCPEAWAGSSTEISRLQVSIDSLEQEHSIFVSAE